MNLSLLNHVASPVTHHPLRLLSGELNESIHEKTVYEGMLQGENSGDAFPVVEGVPMLQPPGYIADCLDESLEILFGTQTMSVIHGIYEEIKEPEEFSTEMKRYIKEHLGAEGVRKAFKDYSALSGEERLKWFYRFCDDKGSSKCAAISSETLETGRKYGTLENGRLRAEQLENMFKKWAVHIPQYVSKVMEGTPAVIVELATGAGLGTLGLIKGMPGSSRLISIDIDYDGVKNAEGLAKYYGIEDRVDPVVANFWFLPFRDDSIDVVCAHYGLDESREVPRTVSEISRVLKQNGKFVNVSREKPEVRLLTYFDGLGLSNGELVELAAMAGLYAGVDETVKVCARNGLVLDEQIGVSPANRHERVISVFGKEISVFKKSKG